MKARLIRYAHIIIERLDDTESSVALDLDGVSIRVVHVSDHDDERMLVVEASTPVMTPLNVPREGRLAIPTEDRRRAERVIERYADALAVLTGKSRKIRSPTACLALVPEDAEATEAFSRLDGLRPEGLRPIISVRPGLPELRADHFHLLADRWLGATLLAEALGNEHPTGKFHELIRVFENAFKKSGYSMVGPLGSFLDTGGHAQATDVGGWIGLRDRATHADLRQQNDLATEADIRPVLPDVEIAAYDVLFNKRKWHDPSSSRRDAIPPGFVRTGSREYRMNQRFARRDLQVVTLDLVDSYVCDRSPGWSEPNPAWLWLDASAIAEVAPTD